MVCASNAPPVAGPATISVCVDEIRRHDVDQILRHPPDRRRKLKQLVRIQVQLAVKAVAVIEVAFHHDLEPAQILEGAGAHFVVTSVAGVYVIARTTLAAGLA